MGLDMYLTGRRYLWGSNENDKKVAEAIDKLDIGTNGMRVKGVECEAMYWRKANNVHGWIVEHVQNGEDDCKEYEVGIDQLQALVDACKKALADRENAAEILPPTSGFFFGGNELDEWYWDNLQMTVDGLSKVLANPDLKDWDFFYQASW
jgi:hypothetical protein